METSKKNNTPIIRKAIYENSEKRRKIGLFLVNIFYLSIIGSMKTKESICSILGNRDEFGEKF
jgi:hypothetical protein